MKQRWNFVQVQIICDHIWQLAHKVEVLEKYNNNNNNNNKIVWHMTLYIVFDS